MAILIVLVLVFGAPTYAAEKSKHNPTGDPQVERGFQEHQKQDKEKREGDKREREGKIREPFDVKKSGETVEKKGK